MLSKNELKYYSSLLQKKFRNSENKFIVEGKKVVDEAISSGFSSEIIVCSYSFHEENEDFIKDLKLDKTRIEVIKNPDFQKLTDTKSPQGIAAVLHKKKPTKEVLSGGIIAALENISDPGNLGTIFRNCDWFGVNTIILSKECAEIYNPKVIRASMGSLFHLNIIEDQEFYNSLHDLKKDNYDIVTADLDGENLYKFKKGKDIVIVFCNEANGPTQELLKITNRKITIPQKGKAESLNVASASAVILSELTR